MSGADDVAAITGLPPEEAAGFLEMAGGNVETAIALFFEMGTASAAPLSASAAPSAPSSCSPVHAMLFGSAAAPSAWIDQGFEFSPEPNSRCGLLQAKNGPCGVLAAVNAEVLVHLGCPQPSAAVDDAALCAALGTVLWRCATDGRISLARYAAAQPGTEIEHDKVSAADAAEVAARLLPLAPTLRVRGGLCLFCYSCLLTRGLDAVAADVALDGGSAPLVVGPHALCGTVALASASHPRPRLTRSLPHLPHPPAPSKPHRRHRAHFPAAEWRRTWPRWLLYTDWHQGDVALDGQRRAGAPTEERESHPWRPPRRDHPIRPHTLTRHCAVDLIISLSSLINLSAPTSLVSPPLRSHLSREPLAALS
jgi:hypothetical protein